MNTAFYTAASGVLWHQKSMDIASNNIANVSTVGYKPQKTAFGDLLYTTMLNEDKRKNDNLQVGHGVKIEGVNLDFAQGSLVPTDRQLDFALVTDGFFAVEKPDGTYGYTRAGNFSLKLEDENAYVVDSSGNYVLNKDMERITLKKDENGKDDYAAFINEIGVFDFKIKYGLSLDGNNLYLQTELSGEAEPVGDYKIMQGYLENSGVEMSKQMVEMIEIQRSFQFNARVVQIADELEQEVNGLRT